MLQCQPTYRAILASPRAGDIIQGFSKCSFVLGYEEPVFGGGETGWN